jgi:hypothetical protein
MGILEDEKQYVDFLIKNELSTNQFLLLYLLYTERMYKLNNKLGFAQSGTIFKWISKGKNIITASEIEDLIKMDYVFGIKQNNQYEIDHLILTNKFFDLMFVNIDAFQEICDLYPDKMIIDNQTVFTKAGDLDKVANNYLKLIKNNLSKHEQIKKVIEFAKERGLCKYKLENFLSKGVIDTIIKDMENVQIKDINDGQQEL